MRKAIGVLAVLVVVLLCGVEVRAAEHDDVHPALVEFTVSRNGVEIPRGGLLEVRANELVTLELIPLSYYPTPVLISGDRELNLTEVIGMTDATANQSVDGVNVHIFYDDNLQTFDITAEGPVDGEISLQLITTITDLNGAQTVISTLYPIRIKTSLSADFRYLFVPKSMSLVDGRGRKVSSVYMTATETRELYVETDDYLSDGYSDNDYNVFPVSSTTLNMAPTVLSTTESDLSGTSTIPTLVGLTPDLPTLEIPPSTIARVRITARNTGGDQSSNYQPVYTDFTYQITFGGTTTGGVALSSVLPNAGVIQAPRVSVVITAYDDAGGSFDDAGGSCNLWGLGALALLAPVMVVRKRFK
ncbi:MAG: hypothetical protein LBQ42_12885 [Synergistaceae bacterium]|nr:hypothetical protein [Synergistaceae bacterium]